MNHTSRVIAVCAAIAAIFAVAIGATSIGRGSEAAVSTVESEHPPATRGPIVGTSVMLDFEEQYEINAEQARIAAYLAALEAERQRQIAEYLAAVEAERVAEEARQAEAARAAAAARRAPAPSAPRSSGVTGACGGATNGADAFIGRESGGSPSIYNTSGSGAWGCYQIMPGTWASSCSDLGTHGSASVEAQAACASRLPLSAWRSSGPT